MAAPKFFEDSNAFRSWLEVNASTATELVVGFRKVATGQPSMSWPDSVDQALCFGWIDGVRKRIDDYTYSIRFTPRKATSIWSAVNIAKFEQLSEKGLMTAAGALAFSKRSAKKSAVYAYEQEVTAELSQEEVQIFKRDKTAWTFFESCSPSYKKVILHWVTTAKGTKTRSSRFTQLVQACSAGLRLR